jgi:predicted glycosyltransferase
MNREAAALHVPVYSIFRGKVGAVDRRLEQEGRLIMIRTSGEVETKIIFKQRDKPIGCNGGVRFALQEIVDHVEDIIRSEYPKGETRKRDRDVMGRAAL